MQIMFQKKVIFDESSRSFLILSGKFYSFVKKINKWIEVFKLDVSLEQDIYVGTIFKEHLKELKLNFFRIK